MRIVVTGGAGFIGSNISDALVERGHEVLVLDDLSSGRTENVPAKARLVELDVSSPEVRAIFEKFKPDVLCHHAAQIDVRRSVADPAFDAEVNVVGSVRLLEICRAVGTRRVLFASTGGAIYGEQDAFPATEAHPARPVSPYGVAKLSVEHYLHYYAVEHGFRPTRLRYANVYGPRQNPHGEAGVVAIFTDKFLAGQEPVINGTGEQTRDFVFVGDVVRANLAALDHDLLGAFNVGTGVETSVNELYEALRVATGSSARVKHVPGKAGEQMRSSLDATALKTATGWKPTTPLEEGLRATVAFFKSRVR